MMSHQLILLLISGTPSMLSWPLPVALPPPSGPPGLPGAFSCPIVSDRLHSQLDSCSTALRQSVVPYRQNESSPRPLDRRPLRSFFLPELFGHLEKSVVPGHVVAAHVVNYAPRAAATTFAFRSSARDMGLRIPAPYAFQL